MRCPQLVQNAAARLITSAPRCDNITPTSRLPSWFSSAWLVRHLVTWRRTVSAHCIRSADTATCITRRTSNIFGNWCFTAASPRLWNSLPINLRQCHSLEKFKHLFKTFLFSAWSHGALWHLPKSTPYINLLTYLLPYLLTREFADYQAEAEVFNFKGANLK